jgi:hypothetical protein
MKNITFVILFLAIFDYTTIALAADPAVINSVTDSLGNVQTNSWGAGEGGGSLITKQDWSTANSWVWTFDTSEYGPNVKVLVN